MGSIMAIGIAVSNSNLLVTFANEIRIEKDVTVKEAALQAGLTRLRPVLMTALAMILGMIPMALGLGEGGEQNAPLGKTVIGGLIVSTISTLVIIPILYSKFRTQMPSKFVLQENYKKEEFYFDQELENERKVAI
jgi:multidrug efflux pump subunit AcrB